MAAVLVRSRGRVKFAWLDTRLPLRAVVPSGLSSGRDRSRPDTAGGEPVQSGRAGTPCPQARPTSRLPISPAGGAERFQAAPAIPTNRKVTPAAWRKPSVSKVT